jgi:hypothetical protein
VHIAVAHQDELRVDTLGEKRFCEGFLDRQGAWHYRPVDTAGPC